MVIIMEKPTIDEYLKNRLVNANKIVVCCIGNELRGDDGVGPYIARQIMEKLAPEKQSIVTILNCGEVPESFTSKIIEKKPTHIILIDAATIGESPGTVGIIEPEDLTGLAISTHSLPLNVFTGYLREQLGGKVDIFGIGIQPKKAEVINSILFVNVPEFIMFLFVLKQEKGSVKRVL